MHGVNGEVVNNAVNDLGSIHWPPVLYSMLRDIITILIEEELSNTGLEFVQDLRLRYALAIFQDSLDNPTTIGVDGKLMNMVSECVDDERDVVHGNPLNGFLDDVIPILIFHTFQNLVFELPHELLLLIE